MEQFLHQCLINCLIITEYVLMHLFVCEAPNKQLQEKLLKIDQTEYNQDSKGALTPAHSDAEEPRGWWRRSQLSKKLPPQKPHRELPYWISALVSPDFPATLRVSLISCCQWGRDVLFCHTEMHVLMTDTRVIGRVQKDTATLFDLRNREKTE